MNSSCRELIGRWVLMSKRGARRSCAPGLVIALLVVLAACGGGDAVATVQTTAAPSAGSSSTTTDAAIDLGDVPAPPAEQPPAAPEDAATPAVMAPTTPAPTTATTVSSTAITVPPTTAPPTTQPDDGEAIALDLMLLTTDDLGDRWQSAETTGVPSLTYGPGCEGVGTHLGSITSAVASQSRTTSDGAVLDQVVALADAGSIAGFYSAWTDEESHDCVLAAVEGHYEGRGLEGSIIDRVAIPSNTVGFGYQVLVSHDEGGGSQTMVWTSTVLVNGDRITHLRTVSADRSIGDLDDVLNAAATRLG